MADPITNPGGRRKANTNEQVTSDMLNDVQRQVSGLLLSLAARLFRDTGGDTPESGFIGDDCLASKGSGSLDVDIAPGYGFYCDSTESDAFEPIYKPIVVMAGFAEELSAHDPADPRYDIVCLAPAEVEDESATVYIKSGGTVSSSTLETRVRYTYAVQVVEGTPAASPSVPSTPAGYIKIAECLVPAASGDVTVTDTRTVLQINPGLAGPPAEEYHHPWVPGTSTELEVTAASYPNVAIAGGVAEIQGRRYVFDSDVLALPTVTGSYLVWASIDGSFNYTLMTGFGHTVDRAAIEQAGGCVLAVANINTGTVTVTVPTDARYRSPYGKGHVHQVARAFFPVITEVGWNGADEDVDVNITVVDAEGNPPDDDYYGNWFIEVEFFDTNWAPLSNPPWTITDAGAGQIFIGPSTTTGKMLCKTLTGSSGGQEMDLNASYGSTFASNIVVKATIISATNVTYDPRIIGGSAWLNLAP